MTQYTILKHKFYVKEQPQIHILEFIISNNGKLISEKILRNTVKIVMDQIANISSRDGLPEYDFGKFSWGAILDDIRKLFILDKIQRNGLTVHLWLDRDNEISFWDEQR